jgi:hypothetical protein
MMRFRISPILPRISRIGVLIRTKATSAAKMAWALAYISNGAVDITPVAKVFAQNVRLFFDHIKATCEN